MSSVNEDGVLSKELTFLVFKGIYLNLFLSSTDSTAIKIEACKPDILVIDKKSKLITIVEIGITSQSQLVTTETEKKRKFDVLANHLGQLYKMKTRIIPWVMTWDGIVTKTHKYYLKELGITNQIEAYMQSITIKKTLESISLDYRCGGEICSEQSLEVKENGNVSPDVTEKVSEGARRY